MSKNKWNIDGRRCEYCDSSNVIYRGKGNRVVKTITVDGVIEPLIVETQYAICKTCTKSFSLVPRGISKHAKITTSLETYLYDNRDSSVSQLCRLTGLDRMTVRYVLAGVRADRANAKFMEMVG